MRVLICGGRDFSNATEAYAYLDWLHKRLGFSCVIEGDAPGADRMAGYWARRNRITDRKFPADWTKHGKAAGPIRNAEMLRAEPALVVAFPGGRGTADMVAKARAAGVPVIEYPSRDLEAAS